jgi:poly(3-hydroxybutyrate) depolymerase
VLHAGRALVTYLTQNYCIDMDRIFAVGVSAGGIMSNMLGCFRGDVLRAIAPASAMMWQNTCRGDVAVMVICGAQDTFNPCNTDAQGEVDFWRARNGCGTQSATSPIASICNAYQGCAAADPVLLCTHSGGHMWPTSNGDFVWQFFMGL